MLFQVTFYGGRRETSVAVTSIEDVRVIVESGANVMVEWGTHWGDAVGGKVVTHTLAQLLAGEEIEDDPCASEWEEVMI